MPEATVLYSVTGVVIAGLVAWVIMVLKQAKEPWARPAPPEEAAEEHATPEEKKPESEEPAKNADGAKDASKLDADDTARATPVALSEGRTKAAEESAAEAPAAEDEPKAEAKKEA